MRASDRVLTVRDLRSVLCNTDVEAWIKLLLLRGGHGMYVSRYIGPEFDCPFVRCDEEVEYKKDLSRLRQHCGGQPLPEIAASIVVLHHPFDHLYFAQRFICWARDYDIELGLHCHFRGIFPGWYNIELVVIPALHQPIH